MLILWCSITRRRCLRTWAPLTCTREIASRLAALGVIGEQTKQTLLVLAGFRNVLVHDYAEVGKKRSNKSWGDLQILRLLRPMCWRGWKLARPN